MSSRNASEAGVGRRLGYLFKHAHLELEAQNDAALAAFGLDSRELGILLTIASHGAPSQHEVAQRLGIDRTTMVTRLDQLEAKGIVTRHPDASDRRRNVVELTPGGQDVVTRATAASDAVERRFLSELSRPEAEQLRELLSRVVSPPGSAGD